MASEKEWGARIADDYFNGGLQTGIKNTNALWVSRIQKRIDYWKTIKNGKAVTTTEFNIAICFIEELEELLK